MFDQSITFVDKNYVDCRPEPRLDEMTYYLSSKLRKSFLLVLKAQLPYKAEGDILNFEDR